ncbi:MAG: DEAD/DEAH box helicase [Sporocytophaga sp.]|uniref:DEAD/DEAH box helicase n=1 Tax=Sporocytophaga sp. TaxID=2231183 RepID=UPI001B2F18EE|nr:DEAD/DEAH box helicase [Sporocytophaga sp.]MBO9700522.1 DEAD/DEAH box helicase [Sporocytophaga sp.]
MSFKNLNLISPILEALEQEGYTQPTSIQSQAIPFILEKKDLLGCAQTGTGKTAAFALPILQLLENKITDNRGKRTVKSLILTPTRELAIQIGDSFSAYGRNTRVNHAVIFGGVSQNPQVEALKRGVDILVATPGRLLDLMNQGFIRLDHIEIFVLDEADRMLDMGFIHDIKKILTKLPAKKQSLFFSATMAPEIKNLAESILVNPKKVEVAPVSSAAETVNQSVYYVEKSNKKGLLIHLLKDPAIPEALIFTRTKHGADRISKDLTKAGITAEAIHGNKSQNARQRALENFKLKKIRVLVATDIAARGIDIEKLSHVINFELPNEPETYVHRIGRTGRAGANGIAIAFCDTEERVYLRAINKLIAKEIPVIKEHPFDGPGIEVPQSNNSRQSTGARQNPSGGAKQNSKPSGSGKPKWFGRKKSNGNNKQSNNNNTSKGAL